MRLTIKFSMRYPIRNLIFEKIKEMGTLNDGDLINLLSKDEINISEEELNKTLLDLEIFGLIRVSWLTKDKRRIEVNNSIK
jgi:hypothetical protein